MIGLILIVLLSLFLAYLGIDICYTNLRDYNYVQTVGWYRNGVFVSPPHYMVGVFFGVLGVGIGTFLILCIAITPNI